MAKVLSYELRLIETPEGEYAEIDAIGLNAYEPLAITIWTPRGSSLIWGTSADGYGRVIDRIKLDSGRGKYKFKPSPECGVWAPDCKILDSSNCGKKAVNCNIKVSAPDQVILGTPGKFLFTNLQPESNITVATYTNSGPTLYHQARSELDGSYLYETIWNQEGTYSIQVSDGRCISHPHIFSVLFHQNEFPHIFATGTNLCAEAINISVSFNKYNYLIGEAGVLKVSFHNTADVARILSTSVDAQFGAGYPTGTIPSVLTLEAGEYKEYEVHFVAGSKDETYYFRVSGTYVCNGLEYSANSGEALALIGKGLGTCSLILEYFGPTGDTLQFSTDNSLELELSFFNNGTVPISGVSIVSMLSTPGLDLDISLPHDDHTLIEVGESFKFRFNVSAEDAGEYTLRIVFNSLRYVCGGELVTLGASAVTTVVATDPIPEPPPEPDPDPIDPPEEPEP